MTTPNATLGTAASTAGATPWANDVHTIGLVSLAHGTSHFFHMLLPPLFPAFIRDFGMSYSELGLLVSVFFVVSGIGQACAGFLVDRVGSQPVLRAALALFVAAALAAAAAQGFWGLALAAALAGLGNAPFHPVDFTIMNHRISPPRLGHAYSVHGICGNLGWAAGPVFMIGLSQAFGSWRAACVGMALWALAVLLLVLVQRARLDERRVAAPNEGRGVSTVTAPRMANFEVTIPEHPMAFLKLPVLWMCFTFFLCSTGALSAIQGFASPALQRQYALPETTTAFVVTAFMICGALGIVGGGFLAARVQRVEVTIALATLFAASCLWLASTGWLPGAAAAVVVAIAGFGTGMAGPSRDLLIKRAAPAGATGRVYGTVYSGVDVGFAIFSPMFGRMLDQGAPGRIFFGAAIILVVGVCTTLWVAQRVRSGVALPVAAKLA
jgi:MFS transporter, FSR family, fosmidomycin resistance protein